VNENGGPFTSLPPPGSNGYKALGLAPSVTFETRDNQVYPRNGWYIEAMFLFYPTWSSSYTHFKWIRADVRKYFPINWTSDRDIIALQLITTFTSDNAPFKDMADVGGSNIMRGYYTGFYRYQHSHALQAELRLGIGKYLGLVSWAGFSLTSEKWFELLRHSIKPNAGVGLRFMINRKDRLNIRLDQGFGNQDQSGFYLDLAEAF
jgi:hypothetical protein